MRLQFIEILESLLVMSTRKSLFKLFSELTIELEKNIHNVLIVLK